MLHGFAYVFGKNQSPEIQDLLLKEFAISQYILISVYF